MDDFATIRLKKRKKARNKKLTLRQVSFYQHQIWLRAFFSNAGFAYSNNRQALLPVNLELQLYLKENHRFWDDHTVEKVKNPQKDGDK